MPFLLSDWFSSINHFCHQKSQLLILHSRLHFFSFILNCRGWWFFNKSNNTDFRLSRKMWAFSNNRQWRHYLTPHTCICSCGQLWGISARPYYELQGNRNNVGENESGLSHQSAWANASVCSWILGKSLYWAWGLAVYNRAFMD